MNISKEDATLRDLFRASAILSRKARACGASRQEIILGHLVTREGLIEEGTLDSPFKQGRLAEIMGITSQSLGEILAKMESDGLVSRQCCEKDRRSIYVTLTDAGREACTAIVEARRTFAHESLSCLDEEERAQFSNILLKLNASL